MNRERLRFARCLTVILLAALPALAAARDEPRSPFDGLRWIGDTVEVRVEPHGWLRLEAINDIRVETISAYCLEQYGDRARKRFREDLVEVLTALGAPPAETVQLHVRDFSTNAARTLDNVAMTAERREKLWKQAQRAEPGETGPRARTITRAAALADLAQLDKRLREQWSYLKRHPIDIRARVEAIGEDLPERVRVADLATDIVRALAPSGDGHARVEEWEAYLPEGYLPFLVSPVGQRLVAFQPGRDAFAAPDHPYLVALDGRPVADWIAAASPFVAAGSPQLVQQRSARMLRYVAFLREQMGLPASETITATFADDAGAERTVSLPLAPQRPTYGSWPRRSNERIENFGYIRVPDMDRSQATAIAAALEAFASTAGLILDVRGNPGGSREVLQTVWPRIVPPAAPPTIVNAAQYRRALRFRATHLAKRSLYVPDYRGWKPDEVIAMDAFLATWQPEWQPPVLEFSFWHFMVLRGASGDTQPYRGHVVILIDEVCFSATDVFVSALKRLPNVTVLGMPTGGGSGYARPGTLNNSKLEVLLSSMVSYQADGRLFDGHGVQPDQVVAPTPGYFIGTEDPQLDAALKLLRSKAQASE